jgi:hypothetical protein
MAYFTRFDFLYPIQSFHLPSPLPLSVLLTDYFVSAKVNTAWAAALDIWSSASRETFSKVSQAKW